MPAPTLPLSTNEKNHLGPAFPETPAAGAAGEEGPDGRPSLTRGLGPCQHRCPRAESQSSLPAPLPNALTCCAQLGVSSGAVHACLYGSEMTLLPVARGLRAW